ncbi:hydroxyacid dehydrogenase [Pseudogracilibacillus auburnensis]
MAQKLHFIIGILFQSLKEHMMKNKTVYIPLDIEYEGKNYLKSRGYKIIIGEDVEKKSVLEAIKSCDAILTRSNVMIDKEVIQAGEKLKIISKYGVGINNIDVDFASKQGIYVTITPEANANVVAEHVMALMLILCKKIMIMDHALRSGNFDIRNNLYSEDLEMKTLGILGLGRIGKLVAAKAYYGFGMNVIGFDPYQEKEASFIDIKQSLHDVLVEADIISLHLPLLPSTHHIIGVEEFAKMKESAYLINTSRGGTVDEKALVVALKKKTIAGAGIDVFEKEPPDVQDELFTLDNVIVTPHSAALSKDGSVKMAIHAALQIDQVLSGKEPSWPVQEWDAMNKKILK